MAAVPRSYKKNVAEGNGIFILSIVIAVIIRIVYFIYFGITTDYSVNGYLWKPLVPYFSNDLASFICSGLFVGGMAFFSSHINTAHVLIRRKTLLPPAVIILLFSCNPRFISMSGEYVSALLALYVIFILFEAYNSIDKQIYAFKTGFIVALGSLFTPVMLIYLPLLWIALGIMRCFNFKAFLATLMGALILYFPAFSFFLFTDDIDTFLLPFVSLDSQLLADFPFYNFDIGNWVILVYSIVLLTVIITDNYINRHKDKIRIRAYLALLGSTSVFAVLAYLFLNIDPLLNIYIALIAGSLLLSHFFALVEQKSSVIIFYISSIVYFLFSFLPFLSL
ncbi:hypothetical protein [Prevotella sp. 10(H)]|uniref:hypothetical protein n=1 Tax=Prevotella sp. 10(H) TaxID=1158294 RepID=UPI0004A76920|nr:hypothetical protein [Prevotella sp. 10(H)]